MSREATETKSLAGKALLAVAFFTCPCHLPIYIVLFGGTALGGYFAENKGLSLVALTVVFIFTLLSGWRMLKARGAG